MARRPFVYWAQNEKQLFLTVDLQDSSDADYSVTDNLFEFRAVGVGAQGRCEYSFELQLFAEVEMEKSNEESGNKLLYILKKKNASWWPTVLKDGSRHSWLRVDFDRFKDPDESEAEDEYEMVNMNTRTPEAEMDAVTQRILRKYHARPKTKSEFINEVKQFAKSCKELRAQYLFTFNLSLFLLHVFLLFTFFFKTITVGNEYFNSFWHDNAKKIKIATFLQLIDIVHALAGFTKGNYRTGLIQVCGRIAMLYIIDGCPDVQNASSTFILIIAYFSIEIFRYPYYAVSSLQLEYWLLTWLRYNTWILFYPLGLLLEGLTIYRTIPYYHRTGKYSIRMPNPANFGFNFGVVLGIFLFFVFPFVAAYLLEHMWSQRYKKYKHLIKKAT